MAESLESYYMGEVGKARKVEPPKERPVEVSEVEQWRGTKRKTAKGNVLLQKNELGHTRVPVTALPPIDHVYGAPPINDGQTVFSLLHPEDENEAPKSKPAAKKGPMVRKAGVVVGSSRGGGRGGGSSARTRPAAAPSGTLATPLPSDRDPKFTYGKKSVPDKGGVADLLKYSGQKEYLAQLNAREEEARKARVAAEQLKKIPGASRRPQTIKLNPLAVPKEEKEPFKLSRFKKVEARTDAAKPVALKVEMKQRREAAAQKNSARPKPKADVNAIDREAALAAFRVHQAEEAARREAVAERQRIRAAAAAAEAAKTQPHATGKAHRAAPAAAPFGSHH